MYDYQMQYPNMNLGVYSPRSVRPSMLVEITNIEVDIAPLNGHIPDSRPLVINAVWLSAVINGGLKVVSEEIFVKACRLQNLEPSIYEVVEVLNRVSDGQQYLLSRVGSWMDVQLALMEGYTVIFGGSVFSSFSRAETNGIVPMPQLGEGLLGGQIINLISLDREKDLGWVIGNRGKSVGREGLFQYRGSHLRHLGIFRDFFLLTPRVN